MRFYVMGGGCYGTFYARQLLRARAAGALAVDEVVVVDHGEGPQAARELGREPPLRFERSSWDDFLDRRLGETDLRSDDQLVTPPFTPHLALAWLLRRVREECPDVNWRIEPFRRLPGTPFQRQADGGPLLLSHADWVCPVNCIEPERCPKTRGPRFWDLDRTVRQLAVALEEGGQRVEQLHLFHCHHLAYGVGAYPLAEVATSRAAVTEAVARAVGGDRWLRFLVGTISHCHGALHLLTADTGMVSVSAGSLLPARNPRFQPEASSRA